ncbi:hypothetical protein F1C10_10925 [Sphingomonas sp. NBWT7]|uniref:hypothetical protein n=1 Tax=Sphingomonas sp. NBWT7 TaxID=2596913 RepID=UPI0016276AE7|nr:hypothetical protein [Sphingomonas sp. NBWT7]QNE32406.1 hypothetical protein F1C10_10925 [Sphingomonas sp. NBWT7]
MKNGPARAGLRRRVADIACRALLAALPPAQRGWGQAIRCETSAITDDSGALLFALDNLRGLLPRAIATRLRQTLASLIGDRAFLFGDTTNMTIFDAAFDRPRVVGIACAIGAVMLGLLYMTMAGAPPRYLAINAGALVIGLTVLTLLGRTTHTPRRAGDAMIVAIGAALLATALLGARADGAARWINVGGLVIQPTSILAPVMLVVFARIRTVPATAGVALAALAIALQPDRAMAGILFCGLATLAIARRDRLVVAALIAAASAFAATLAQADTLIAVPYVDQILFSSFDVHAGAGLAIWAGLALLLLPSILGWYRNDGDRSFYAMFGAIWLATILAAALGNYPTPVVGYGGSAIIGYALSLIGLPKSAVMQASAATQRRGRGQETLRDRHLRVGIA